MAAVSAVGVGGSTSEVVQRPRPAARVAGAQLGDAFLVGHGIGIVRWGSTVLSMELSVSLTFSGESSWMNKSAHVKATTQFKFSFM